jgi:hypothetical protein
VSRGVARTVSMAARGGDRSPRRASRDLLGPSGVAVEVDARGESSYDSAPAPAGLSSDAHRRPGPSSPQRCVSGKTRIGEFADPITERHHRRNDRGRHRPGGICSPESLGTSGHRGHVASRRRMGDRRRAGVCAVAADDARPLAADRPDDRGVRGRRPTVPSRHGEIRSGGSTRPPPIPRRCCRGPGGGFPRSLAPRGNDHR